MLIIAHLNVTVSCDISYNRRIRFYNYAVIYFFGNCLLVKAELGLLFDFPFFFFFVSPTVLYVADKEIFRKTLTVTGEKENTRHGNNNGTE